MRSRHALAVVLWLCGCASSESAPTLRAPDVTNEGNVVPFDAHLFAGGAIHMVTSPAGESVVVGAFRDSIDYGFGERVSLGKSDMFVAKVDTNGKPLWLATAGTEEDDEPAAAALEDDGSVTILATHSALPFLFGDPLNAHTTFLARVDARGHVLEQGALDGAIPSAIARWKGDLAVSASGNGVLGATMSVARLDPNERATTDVSVTADHGAVRALAVHGDTLAVAGNYSGTARVAGTTLPIAANAGFVATLSRPGDLGWSRVWRGATLRAATFAPDGVLLVGGSCTAGCAVPASEADDDVDGAFVAALDMSGRVLWSRRFPGRSGERAIYVRAAVTSVTVGPDGVVHAVGTFDGRIDFGDRALDPGGLTSVFHVALTRDGKTAWSGRYPTRGVFANPTVTTDAAGHVFVSAGFWGSLDLHTAARAARDTDVGWFFARVTD